MNLDFYALKVKRHDSKKQKGLHGPFISDPFHSSKLLSPIKKLFLKIKCHIGVGGREVKNYMNGFLFSLCGKS